MGLFDFFKPKPKTFFEKVADAIKPKESFLDKASRVAGECLSSAAKGAVSAAKSMRPSFKQAVDMAPNKIGVYLIWYNDRVMYVGRAVENRPGQSPCGLRKRLQEHYRGASAGKPELYQHRDQVFVTWKTFESEEEAREEEARLIRRYDTVENGSNLRYED